MFSSPVDDDMIVVAIGGTNSCPFDGYALLRDGELKPAMVSEDDLRAINKGYIQCEDDNGGFDIDGRFYAYVPISGLQRETLIVPMLLADDGLYPQSSVIAATPSSNLDNPLGFAGGKVINATGEEMDLLTGTVRKKFVNDGTELDQGQVLDVAVDMNSASVHFLVTKLRIGGPESPLGGGTVFTHDMDSGELMNSSTLDAETSFIYHDRALLMMPFRAGILSHRSGTLYIIAN
jgi:hypothetical protein